MKKVIQKVAVVKSLKHQSEGDKVKVIHRKSHITLSDKVLRATFLRLIPASVTPNQLTMSRYFMVPIVATLLYLHYYAFGIVLFIIAALTDALDGARARTTRQITEWGEINDPAADKLLIGVSALILMPRFLSFWLVIAIFSMELVLVGSAYYFKNRGWHVSANWWGKTKMILQSVGIGLVLLFALTSAPYLILVAEYVLYGSLFFGLISIITYGI